ncbi:hypothetical protein JI666_15005 [Bacillus sp. NTK071]|uniref:DUF6944 family repetitive protein n=1 Tax=Bacillus sp. NTK071 TaxID=2802175 RepID=UPI001A8DAA24|nr:hypothetical protein [Bacillus sp. NTK071]MBN8210061.1 hypothetical protein [Bacillus sp. NTK071]
MDNEQKVILGAWITATGTIASAIGISSFMTISEEILNSLTLIGNVLQATGNAIVADTIDTMTLNKIGSQIQAIGNSTVVTGIILASDEKTGIVLDIKGNLLQALGGGTSLSQALSAEPSEAELYNINGHILSITGNSLQAYAGARGLRDEDGEIFNVVGSWIQATGSVIGAIGQTKYPNQS